MKNRRLVISIILIIVSVLIAAFVFRGFIVNKFAGNIILKSGKPVQFGSYTVLVEKIEGNKLFGIKITSKERKLEAKSGGYEYLPKENVLKFNLFDGVASDVDPQNPAKFYSLTFKTFNIKIRLNQAYSEYLK